MSDCHECHHSIVEHDFKNTLVQNMGIDFETGETYEKDLFPYRQLVCNLCQKSCYVLL